MSFIMVKCAYCDGEFEKTKGEYNRSIKLGRKQYCSPRCYGKDVAIDNIKSKIGVGDVSHFKVHPNNRCDEFSPFKLLVRRTKFRNKGYDIDLEYVKGVWDKQNGICPYTNIKLILPISSNRWPEDSNKLNRASIDRVDPNIGYMKGNIQIVSQAINIAKSDMSDNDLLTLCESVVRNASNLLYE